MLGNHKQWRPEEADTLRAILEDGVGAAATVLHEMTGSEIRLTTPELVFADPPELAAAVTAELPGETVAVSQRFAGKVDGRAALVLTTESSDRLVALILGDAAEFETQDDLTGEALGEIGNIVLNSTLGALADRLTGELTVGLPELHMAHAADLLLSEDLPSGADAFLVRVRMQSEPEGFGGMIIVTLRPGHLKLLNRLISDYAVDMACA